MDEERREDREHYIRPRKRQMREAVDRALAGKFTPDALRRLVDTVTVETVRSYAVAAPIFDDMGQAEVKSDELLEELPDTVLADLPVVTKKLRKEVSGG